MNTAKLVGALFLWSVSVCSYASQNDDLINAAAAGDVNLVRQLVAMGANVNAADKDGVTALHASLRYQFDNTSVYKPASFAGIRYLTVVKYLIEQGADVNRTTLRDNVSPIHTAVSNGFLDAVAVLIARGAGVNARTATGATPLVKALRYPDVVKLLISNGADVSSRNSAGWTALHVSTDLEDRPEIARLLIARGADVNASGLDGRTPLHQAAKYQAEKMAVLLISSGARLDVRDNEGNTPYDFARNSMKSDFESLFLPVDSGTKPHINCSDLDILNYVEWHVCRFPLLTVLDSKLNDVYLAAMKVAKYPTYLREEQRAWMKERDRLCKVENHECSMAKLMRMYGERTEQLKQAVTEPSTSSGKNLCIELIQLADAGKLKSYAVRNSRAPTEQELADLSGVGEGQLRDIYEIPLDRTTVTEKFGRFSTGGTCASTQVFNIRRLTQRDSPSTGWVDVYDPNDIIRWAYWGGGDYPIEYQGQFFMVTADLADDNRVNMISSIQQDGTILPICTVEEASFEYAPGAASESVCKKIARGTIRPISWKQPDIAGNANRDAFVARFGLYADSVATARIDLDGDGLVEDVGRFTYSSGAGCGSAKAWGRVLGRDLQSVVKGKLDDVISQLGHPFDVYADAGVYYIRSSTSITRDQIVRVRNGAAEKVCELHRRSKSRPKVLFEMK